MPPRFTIDRLPEEQFQFVINAINKGGSDREICADFAKQFGAPLAKSSLGRWRKTSGGELAQRYRLAHHEATQVLGNSPQADADKFGLVMAAVEDSLVTAMRQLTAENPLKLMAVRQKEGDRRLKERMLELKEKEFARRDERARQAESLDSDRLRIGLETLKFMIMWLTNREPELFQVLIAHTRELSAALKSHLQERFPNVTQNAWSPGDSPVNAPLKPSTPSMPHEAP